MDSDDIDELYEWINKRYEQYANDEISEEQYLKDLDQYKQKLAESEVKEEVTKVVSEEERDEVEEKKKSLSPNNVRSTSIAGLRKKLMEEMNR